MRKIFLILYVLAMPLCLMADGAFVRITQIEELVENGEYIIVAADSPEYPGVYVFTSTKAGSSNYLAYKVSDKNEVPATMTTSAPNTIVWQLAYSADEVVLVNGGKMLLASSSVLSFADAEYTSWKVKADADGRFFLTFGDRYLKANIRGGASTKSRFGAYATPANNMEVDPCHVYIYRRKVAPTDMTEYYRSFSTSGDWETICLPFACKVPAGCEAYEVTGKSEVTTESAVSALKHSEPVELLSAGIPYILTRAYMGMAHFVKSGASVSQPRSNYLQGTFAPVRIGSGYVLDGKDFVRASSNCLVPAFRAYIP